ncbi:MAG: tetratricopeptide repeat protein [Pirellulaceae bacterium]
MVGTVTASPAHRFPGLLLGLLGLLTVLSSGGCNTVATGQNMQGARLYEKGQYYPAMEKFQQAMASNPGDANAYYNLASTLHQLGVTNKDPNMLKQAEAMYNQCLDRNPNHADCHRALAVLLVQTDRTDRAFALLKNWAVRSPQNADARVELARLYEEFGDTKTAELQLQQALQMDQTNKRAWTAMAYLRESRGDVQQALANYQRAYALDGYNPALANRIAALNQTSAGTLTAPVADGSTRTVDSSTPAPRY